MSSVLDERDAYLKSPYFKKHEYSDFSPFYITITICTVIGLTIFLINIFLGCCSRYSEYWNDRHTGKSIASAPKKKITSSGLNFSGNM
nr:unnamed protein product [Callosobruchus chinensis]